MRNIIYKIVFSGIAVCTNAALHAQVQTGDVPYTIVQGVQVVPAPAAEPKMVFIETNCSSGATVYIENVYWRINVKTSRHNKVRLETTVTPTAGSKTADAKYFSDMNVSLKGTENQVVVKSDYNSPTRLATGVPSTSYGIQNNNPGNTIIYLDKLSQGATSKRLSIARRALTVYIPSGAKLEIESKYGDVVVENNIKEVKAYVNNGSLDMKDAAKAFVRTTYVNINAGDIKDAEFDITNGRMVAGNFDKLVINSKSSDIEFHSAGDMNIHSTNDQYEIDQVASLSGTKSYGSLRISNVKSSFDVTGANADIKIRHIEPEATAIKINNRYADIRLPVSNLENYSVEYEGQLSNIYAPFRKETPASYNPTKFKTIIGDSTGKATGFLLKCSNCTIDFR